ncbi:aminoglycoside phosphotransferase [Variovorax guangxiensis]|uniref:Aminoglycoside phosphotransferase n=1 Tax=Variovorax guangxiensis TaxID=1775474 RepID=A0A3S0ZCE4_9BURK|nr:bifunctional aminoglycoside phosphotransferase/ATP-binding protein [Variovorax guangxiensis]RUR66353.1 aminoglycoside phosphotransferase [Variovorax guangxiensis]
MDTTLIDALRAQLQQETGQPVALVETHISWVLLTPTQALKLKKPVRLPFLDFGSVESRRHFCEEELRLNRRFAPTLYIDVAPVCGTRESPRIGGGGTPIDHVVRMRRFAESALLRNLLVSNALEPRLLDGFAKRLAGLHGEAQRAAPVSCFGAPDAVVRAANDVLASLRAQLQEGEADRAASLAGIGAWIEEQGQALRMAWIARQQAGAVRECHGDLHLANVVLVDGALTPFDCIEFDPALRWIDVMSDVAFLTMDLKAHGHGEFAFRFLDGWLQHSGDYAGLQVLRFYEVYRALVRAMASGMAPGDRDGKKKGPDYLASARRLLAQPEEGAQGARLMIAHGLSGSGKSSVALQLLCAAGAVRVRSDVERKRLFGLAPLERSAAAGLDIYGAEATRRTFEKLRACARDALLAGYPVIVDAAFLRRAERQGFEALATELRVPFSILDCSATPATLRRRVAERDATGTDASEAGLAVLERQLATHEPLDADERRAAIEVSTEATVDIEQLRARWRSAGFERC